ncbi:MAG: hypothetical protein NT049_02800 [Planctomycetota bacterium]|nr:hypothetical protein [Planctomycetota bacterium]
MRKAVAIVGLGVLLSAMLLVAGCENPTPKAAEGRDVVRPRLGFALDVAKDWNFRDLYGDVVLEMFPQPPAAAGAPADAKEPPAAKHSRATMNVVVVDRGGMPLTDWATQAIEDSQELQSDLEVVSRTPAKLADGREALLVVLKSPRGVQPILQRMLLTMTDRRAYALLATAPESDLAAAEPVLKKTFDSFIVW